MLDTIDKLLDRITMYRLLLYYLIGLVLVALGLSVAGDLHFTAISIIESTVIALVTCLVTNKVFAYVFDAPTNFESSYITALILILIVTPPNGSTSTNLTFIAAASGLAIASKYILTVNKKHLFNPAAVAVVLTALGPRQSASWWVGTSAMLPFVIIGGLLLVRKIHRERMVFTFFGTSLVATAVYSLMTSVNPVSAIVKTIMTSAMFFLGFVMLTEPLTTPPTKNKQSFYAILMGIMFPPQFHILSLYSTPELALVAGNFVSFLISPRVKLFPTVTKRVRITPDSIDFVFNPNRKFSYEPGQYMEWTLQHSGRDSRGDRRYFTLASSPTEYDVRIGVKFYDKGSSYKEAMLRMDADTNIVADQITGNFTMPKNKNKKLAFIAGGIGVTPFRSMIKYLDDTKEARDVVMLYSARTEEDFAYTGVFEQARQNVGIKTIYVKTGKGDRNNNEYVRHGRISTEMIKETIPDYAERIFYLSGTNAMVHAMKSKLISIGVPASRIKVDYFSGYN